MKSVVKLGTRKSLLAWAQSGWVAKEIERLNPGISVERVGIETQGDRIVDIPLRKVEGKEFFVAEIDQALSSGEVDLTVHSLKDLSLERPKGLYCGAIPKRENPRDVVLFGPQALERIRAGKKLKVGTSSPRRLENIPVFLKRALPQISSASEGTPELEFLEIRGNVNTRLSRVQEPVESDRYLDAVVLAFAGLIRLWADPAAQIELKRLLQGVRWMIMPLRECPAAPGQGALAVECRADDERLKGLLAKLHDPETARQIEIERNLLAESGGGCHQRFGATSVSQNELGDLFFVRGALANNKQINYLSWNEGGLPSLVSQKTHIWDGSQWKGSAEGLHVDSHLETREKNPAVFLAHSRALPTPEFLGPDARVWVSGVESWYKLAAQGLWVEGCAESLGFEFIESTLKEPVLQLPDFKSWIVLTHVDALDGWTDYEIQVIPTYKINLDYGKDAQSDLKAATHVFWSSGTQYLRLKEWVKSDAIHACGPGKTAARLRENHIKPLIFPTAEEWRKWIVRHP